MKAQLILSSMGWSRWLQVHVGVWFDVDEDRLGYDKVITTYILRSR